MPAQRPRDTVHIEVIGKNSGTTVSGGRLDQFTSLQIRNDLTMPSEAMFEIGDDGTYDSMGNLFQPGVEFQVFVNDIPRMKGRAEALNIPFDVNAGGVVQFTVRTKLSDAMYASATPGVRVQDTSIRQFLLDLYGPLGYTESDFSFSQWVERDLLTGQRNGQGETPKDLEAIQVDEARIRPPETIYAAADRHLRRHGLMHWDGPAGNIVVGTPNDQQTPIYTFNMFRGEKARSNNCIAASRTLDWSGVPAAVGVFGVGGKRDFTKSRVAAVAENQDVIEAGFYRPVLIVSEGVKTQELATRSAYRELSARNKQKDAFAIEVDGLSYWDGQNIVNYGIDTVAQVNSNVAGGRVGAYYLHAVTMKRDASGGDSTSIDLLQQGVWRL